MHATPTRPVYLLEPTYSYTPPVDGAANVQGDHRTDQLGISYHGAFEASSSRERGGPVGRNI